MHLKMSFYNIIASRIIAGWVDIKDRQDAQSTSHDSGNVFVEM